MSGENYESLLKEMETLKGRLEEERLKLNDVACKFIYSKQVKFSGLCLVLNPQCQLSPKDLKAWVK